ncbi:MAG: hypothetical protein JWO95_902 [Verrucomicrobiales bacterium]|nr:hypothetical protein [Verrucomicrobiales bacterium]
MARRDTTFAWVTLTNCRTLAEADLLATQLRAAQIAVLIPDESLMANIDSAANTFGYVRVQVHSEDYESAREFLRL